MVDMQATKLSHLPHSPALLPAGTPTCLVISSALIMRVMMNKLLALFSLYSSSVNSQHVYLAHGIWKDKYIKQQNFNKYGSVGLTSGCLWERGCRNVALPTFLLLLVTEHWNKQLLDIFFKNY